MTGERRGAVTVEFDQTAEAWEIVNVRTGRTECTGLATEEEAKLWAEGNGWDVLPRKPRSLDDITVRHPSGGNGQPG